MASVKWAGFKSSYVVIGSDFFSSFSVLQSNLKKLNTDFPPPPPLTGNAHIHRPHFPKMVIDDIHHRTDPKNQLNLVSRRRKAVGRKSKAWQVSAACVLGGGGWAVWRSRVPAMG